MLKLVFVSGPNAGTEFVLQTEFAYIGREVDNSVVLDDAKLSRYHFCVAQAPEGYEVIDNQSTNGTYLNGARIERQYLQTGDEIQVGNSLIRVDISGVAQAQAPQEQTTGSFSIQSMEGSFETSGDYITAGRSGDNHIHLDDQKVSREHAHFIFRGGSYFIKDNNSVNGTYFKRAGESEEKRIVEEPIQNGDEARVGSYKLKFTFPTPRLLQISVVDPSVSDEYGVEAANEVEENDEKQQEQKLAEFDVPKASADQVMEFIPKDIAERGSKQRFATLIVDAIPKAVLEATKDAKEEKRKVPAWVATTDVINDGRRLWYVGGSVAAAAVILLAMFLTGFTRPFMNRPLSKYHQSDAFSQALVDKGIGDGCAACHTSFKGVEVENCKKCHPVAWTPFGEKHHDNAAFNTAANERQKREECLACHSEHMGVEYSPADPAVTENGCWNCHRHKTSPDPKDQGLIERGYHEKDKPKYSPQELISQDTGLAFMGTDGKPYPDGAPGLNSESFGSGDANAWRDMIHGKHGEVPGYCNSCHGPRTEKNAEGKEEVSSDPKKSCLDCHRVNKDSSCLTCHEQHKGTPTPSGTRTADIKPSLLSQIPGGAAGGVMALLLFIPAFVVALNKRRRGEIIPVNKEVKAQKEKLLAIEKMKAEGKFEKVTVIIKKELCIGCSGCVNSCPYDVLEIDQATHKSSVVAMEKCLGDMKCSKACPTGACIVIKGDKIPEVEQVTIDDNHESNVPGLYVIGEGCGKPLIKNAINHGKIAVDHIAAKPNAKGNDPDVYDVIVVGSGPGGLSAGCSAKEHGLKYLVLEKADDTTDTIRNFPKAKVVLAEPVSIPLAGKLWMEDTNKETLIAKWEEIIKKTGLEVTLNQEAVDVSKAGDIFTVKTPRGSYKGRRVVLAPGTRGAPNKIGCPGEDLMHPKDGGSRVQYRLTDTDPYKKKHCLVLGGGDSAVEAARSLADVGAFVTLAYRKDKFDRIKERNLEETLKYTKSKKIKLYLMGNCKELKNGPKGPVVVIKHEKGPAGVKGTEFALNGKPGEDELPNDYVFALLGAQAPSKFFKNCGIEVKKVKMA
jgi:thioredoxin reductase/pSer/pThr/pTyr-binding forkhead associated (FHA) protein